MCSAVDSSPRFRRGHTALLNSKNFRPQEEWTSYSVLRSRVYKRLPWKEGSPFLGKVRGSAARKQRTPGTSFAPRLLGVFRRKRRLIGDCGVRGAEPQKTFHRSCHASPSLPETKAITTAHVSMETHV